MVKALSPAQLLAQVEESMPTAVVQALEELLRLQIGNVKNGIRLSMEDIRKACGVKGVATLPRVEDIVTVFTASGWDVEYLSPAHAGEDPFIGLEFYSAA